MGHSKPSSTSLKRIRQINSGTGLPHAAPDNAGNTDNYMANAGVSPDPSRVSTLMGLASTIQTKLGDLNMEIDLTDRALTSVLQPAEPQATETGGSNLKALPTSPIVIELQSVLFRIELASDRIREMRSRLDS